MRWQGKELDSRTNFNAAVASCKTKQDALMFFGEYSAEVGEKVAQHNIGYSFGDQPREEYDRLLALFEIPHPVFGFEHLTPGEILARGIRMGQLVKEHSVEDALNILKRESLRKTKIEDLNPWHLGSFE